MIYNNCNKLSAKTYSGHICYKITFFRSAGIDNYYTKQTVKASPKGLTEAQKSK